jgi:hypothetical protein
MPITIKKMNETTFKVTVWDQTTTSHLAQLDHGTGQKCVK